MADGSEGWLEELRWLRALARELVADAASADDLVQQAALLSLRRSPDPEPADRGWRAGVLRVLAHHRHREGNRRRRREARAARGEAVPSSEAIVERLEIHQQVIEAILALDEAPRRLVALCYFEERTCAEIAREAGEPEPTVRSRLRRTLAALRDELDRRSGGDRRKWAVPLVAWLGLSSGGAADLAAAGGTGAGGGSALAAAPASPSPSASASPASPLPRHRPSKSRALEGGLIVSGKKIASVAGALIIAGIVGWVAVDRAGRGTTGAGVPGTILGAGGDARQDDAVAALRSLTGEEAEANRASSVSRLAGTVVDLADDAPIDGAEVAFLDGERTVATVRCDPRGRYEVDVPPAREGLLLRAVAAAPGYVTGAIDLPAATYPWRDPLPPIRLGAGIEIEGVVLSAAGEPVPGAELFALSPVRLESDMGGAGGQLVRRGSEVPGVRAAGADGRFHIVLPAGESAILARAGAAVGCAVVRLPENAGEELAIELPSVETWSGVVQDEAGSPVAGARVAIRISPIVGSDGIPIDGARRIARESRTDPAGRFAVAVGDSEWSSIEVTHPDHLPKSREFSTLTAAEWHRREFAPTILTRGRTLRGRLSDPIAGIAAETRLTLAIGRRTIEGTCSADGEFILRGVSPLDAEGELRVPGALSRDLEWPPGAGEHDLGTVLLDRGRRIRLRVTDAEGAPLAGAAVLTDERASRTGARPASFVRTGENGIAELLGLSPGPVAIAVWAPGLAQRRCEVDPGEGELVELRLERPAELRGRLSAADGTPIAGAALSLRLASERPRGRDLERQLPPEGATQRLRIVAGLDGGFRWPEVPAGSDLLLDVSAAGRYPTTLPVSALAAGERRDLGSLSLDDGASLRVRVRDSAGSPVPGALIEVSEPIDKGARSAGLPRVTVIADGAGVAAVHGLPAGKLFLEVRHADHVPVRETVLIDGAETRHEVVFVPGVAWEVEVVDDAGAAVPGAAIRVGALPGSPEMGETRAYARTDASGRARLSPLPPIGCGFSVRSFDHSSHHGQAETIADLPPRIVLSRGSRLRVEIDRPAGGPPIEHALCSVRSGNLSSNQGFGEDPRGGVVGSLPPGPAEVELRVPGYAPERVDIELVAGEEHHLRFRPVPDQAPIEVMVVDRDGIPVPGCRVEVHAVMPGGGSSQLGEMGGGRYRGHVQVGAERVDIAVTPERLAPTRTTGLDPRATPLVIEVGPSSTVLLEAHDPSGAPVAGLRVEIALPPNAPPLSFGLFGKLLAERTDETGRMTLDGFPPGEREITLSRDRIALAKSTVRVAEGETLAHRIAVPRLVEILGRVLAGGRPFAAKQVNFLGSAGVIQLEVEESGTFHGFVPEAERGSFTVWGEGFQLAFPDVPIGAGGEVVLSYEPVEGELRIADESGRAVGGFTLSLHDPRSRAWYGNLAVDAEGIARYRDLQAGRYAIDTGDLAEELALSAQEIEISGGTHSLEVVGAERVVVDLEDSNSYAEVWRITADGEWRFYRRTGSGERTTHLGPRDASPGRFVIAGWGRAPRWIETASGAPESPVVASDRPGGTLYLPPFPTDRGEPQRVEFEPIDGDDLPAGLRTRRFEAGWSIAMPLPAGRFRVMVHGANGLLSTREVDVTSPMGATIAW